MYKYIILKKYLMLNRHDTAQINVKIGEIINSWYTKKKNKFKHSVSQLSYDSCIFAKITHR